jgi:hypothetical protein
MTGQLFAMMTIIDYSVKGNRAEYRTARDFPQYCRAGIRERQRLRLQEISPKSPEENNMDFYSYACRGSSQCLLAAPRAAARHVHRPRPIPANRSTERPGCGRDLLSPRHNEI